MDRFPSMYDLLKVSSAAAVAVAVSAPAMTPAAVGNTGEPVTGTLT